MEFEWDEAKNEANVAKHKVSFETASMVWDGDVVEFVDERYDYGGSRIVAIGQVEGVELTVVYTLRRNVRRIISARRASRYERRTYREVYPGNSP